jgi:hypothetical protein
MKLAPCYSKEVLADKSMIHNHADGHQRLRRLPIEVQLSIGQETKEEGDN